METHKHMIDISGVLPEEEFEKKISESQEDLHERLANFVLDNFDWYDLYDSFGDYGDYGNPHDAVEAAIYDMSEGDLIDAINEALEENYWNDQITVIDAAKSLIDEYLKNHEESKEFDDLMEHPMEDIEGLTEAKSSTKSSFGYAISKNMNVLNMCRDKQDLVSFMKQVCEPLIDNLDQKLYYEKVMTNLTKKSFTKGLEYIIDIMLKGEDNGVIPSKSSKKYESLNWKDVTVSPTDFECKRAVLEEREVKRFSNPKTWSLRDDAAYFKSSRASALKYNREKKTH